MSFSSYQLLKWHLGLCLFGAAHHLELQTERETYRDGNVELLVACVEFPAKPQRRVRGVLAAGKKQVVLRRVRHRLAR